MIAGRMLGLMMIAALCAQPALADADALFGRGRTFEGFIAAARLERARWMRVTASAEVPPAFVTRLQRAGAGLRLLIVAEDWCVDSANTVPFVARLASDAGVETRIIDRAAGRELLDAHRTPDGRVATPLVVVLRDHRSVGAWVERPAPLNALFRSLATSAESLRQLADRQTWYDQDRGRTALSEILTLVERSGATR